MTASALEAPARGRTTIPAAPTWVVVEMFELGTTAHEHIDGAVRTPCGRRTWPLWIVGMAKALRLRPKFCTTCWPGLRCRICSVPSGDSVECVRCSAVSIGLDKAFERSQS